MVADTVRIAMIGPFSGAAVPEGLSGRNCVRLAVAQRNAANRMGPHFEVAEFDDACDPATGLAAVRRAGDDKQIVAAVAHYCSAVALATVHEFHAAALPAVMWGTIHPDITNANDYPEIHRVNGTWLNQEEAAAAFFTKLGYRRWALIHDDSSYGRTRAGHFPRCLTQLGGTIAAAFEVAAERTELELELAQIAKLAPDIVYVAAAPADWFAANPQTERRRTPAPLAAIVCRRMAELGIRAQFQTTPAALEPQFLALAGRAAEGSIAVQGGAPIDRLPGGPALAADYEAAGFAEPLQLYGAFAYAAATLAMDAVERAAAPTRAGICAVLNKIADHPTVLGPVTFDAHGQNRNPPVTFRVVEDGRWILWADSRRARASHG
jgi:branched-chain amino acid transport system substrate-binding protein